MDISKFLSMYVKLTKEQKEKIFTKEQIKTIDIEVFFEKLYSDIDFRKDVCDAIANQLYDDFREWVD